MVHLPGELGHRDVCTQRALWLLGKLAPGEKEALVNRECPGVPFAAWGPYSRRHSLCTGFVLPQPRAASAWQPEAQDISGCCQLL